jgi:molybdopterin molybdotransferase
MKTIEEVWALLDATIQALPPEEVPLDRSVGRVLRLPVVAPVDQPLFDHSAMDGFAFAEECPPVPRPVVREIPAGTAPEGPLQPGTSARIFTGAIVPEGTFGVVRQEDCTVSAEGVQPVGGRAVRPGENIRRRGTFALRGAEVLPAGTILEPGSLAIAASVGVDRVTVSPRPAVTHLLTGAEIVAAGHTPRPGQIFDSNGPLLAGIFAQAGLPLTQSRVADSLEALAEEVASCRDPVLLISGGSGPGDYDFTESALRRAGFTLHFDRIHSRPGKPLLFATREARIAFGLPGNPLSHWVCHHAFVRRALHLLQGKAPPPLVPVFCPKNFPTSDDPRRTWTPARVEMVETRLIATPLPWQHSGDLTPLAAANALLLDTPHPVDRTISALLL